jgi:7,8-dihydropterin-6-yl-methyl-4-(beta-D-ribofuranosyl)aminobenzene 5'-phosphate synthase
MASGSALRAVDRLEVCVVVDNVLDLLSTVPQSVTPEMPSLIAAGATELSGSFSCCAAWGLSLLIRTYVADEPRTVLFDAGPEGDTLRANARKLGLDFTAIDAVVLSHGHWDHAGGLQAALGRIAHPVPMHVNPGMFESRGFELPSGKVLPMGEVPSPAALAAAGGEVVNDAAARTIVEDRFFLSGEIPRVTSYERGLPPQVKRGRGGEWEPDPLVLDERFLAVHVRGRGVVVFSACSHAGIVNVVTRAAEVFDPVPIHGVVGGLHLSGAANEQWIEATVDDLARFRLGRIVPAHCTGYRAVHRLIDRYGEIVIPSAVGQLHRI